MRAIKQHPYLFLCCVCLTALMANLLFVTFDTDILWHYKLGEEIVRIHSVSMADSFSWQQGLKWIQYEWLYDVLLYFVIHIFQMKGYILLFAANLFLLYWGGSFLSKAKSRIGYLITVTACLFLIPKNSGNRPSEFSVWLIILAIWLYQTQIKQKWIWFFLLGVFMANFHGAVVISCTVILIILMGTEALWDIREKKFRIKGLISHGSPILWFLGGTIINPAGLKMHVVASMVPFYESTKQISEWQPWKFNYGSALLFLLLMLPLGYACCKAQFSRKVSQVTALCCALAILSMASTRGAQLFMFIYLIFAYRYLEIFFADFFGGIKKLHFAWRPGLVIMGILSMGLSFVFTTSYPQGTFQEYISQNHSSEIIKYLSEHPGKRLLNGYTDGNYLIYHNIPCFIDSRQSPYVKEGHLNSSLDDYMEAAASHDKTVWDNFFSAYCFDCVYVTEELDIDWYLNTRPDFQKIMEYGEESIWIRKEK